MKAIVTLILLLASFSLFAQSTCSQSCSDEHRQCRNAMHQSCSGVANMAGCVRSCAMGDVACSMEQLRCTRAEQSKLKQCQRENDSALSNCNSQHEQCEIQCAQAGVRPRQQLVSTESDLDFEISNQARNSSCLSVKSVRKDLPGGSMPVVSMTNNCGGEVYVYYCWNPKSGIRRNNTFQTCGAPVMNLQRVTIIQAGDTIGGNPYDWDLPMGFPSTLHYFICVDGASDNVRWTGSGLSGRCMARDSKWSK